MTPFFNFPVSSILEIGGICHHVCPVAHNAAASVLTTGVPKHPIPPYIFEWLSDATAMVPGQA